MRPTSGGGSVLTRDIEKLKIKRIRSINANENRLPFLSRGLRRYRQLSRIYPQHKVVAYFLDRLIFHWNSWMNSKRIKIVKFLSRKILGEKINNADFLVYSIRITGGLGDALIAARMVRDLQKELGSQAEFDVYFHSPATIEPFFKFISGFRAAIHSDGFDATAPYYHFSLVANQFVYFLNQHLDYRFLVNRAPEVLKMVSHLESLRKPIDKYIITHPALDGAFADLAVRQGRRRMTFLHEMLGISYGGDRLDLPIDTSLAGRLGLSPERYITVHDGWDNKFKLVSARPTKAVPLQSWAQIIQEIKAQRPNIQIVQLGGKTGAEIPGVDVNLKDKLSFLESVSVLAGSRLHLDTESGLVHVSASLGVRSVVMFGPTNVEWFSYPQNINISPKQCGNCWWSTDSWMDVCVAGHDVPVCTSNSSIPPMDVAMRVIAALDDQEDRNGAPTLMQQKEVSHGG